MATTNTLTPPQTTPTFTIERDRASGYGFNVYRNGVVLVDSNGLPRNYVSRAGARKRVSREMTGNFHS